MSNKAKNYGGILGHENQSDIDKFIINSKAQKMSFRDIEKELKIDFGLVVSYVTLSAYYKEVLGGDDLDFNNQDLDIKTPYLNNEILEKLLSDPKSDKSTVNDLYANILALCASNLEAFKQGKERLKIEYVKYLKDIDGIVRNQKEQ
jgi:hypothetical protein